MRTHFAGNKLLDDATLRAVLHVDKWLPDDSGRPPSALLLRDAALLSALYYDWGYMQSEIGPSKVTEAADGPFVDITFTIANEGKRFRIRKLTAYERDDGEKKTLADDDVRRRIRPVSGEWFSRKILVEDLTELRTFYRDQGYAEVEALPETELTPSEGIVDIVIPVTRGPLVQIETIVIAGNAKTSTERIRSELRIREGELFNETRLQESKRSLESLFRHVEVTLDRGSAPNLTKITFEVAEN